MLTVLGVPSKYMTALETSSGSKYGMSLLSIAALNWDGPGLDTSKISVLTKPGLTLFNLEVIKL